MTITAFPWLYLIIIALLLHHQIIGLNTKACSGKSAPLSSLVHYPRHSFISPTITSFTTSIFSQSSRSESENDDLHYLLTEMHRWQGSSTYIWEGGNLLSTDSARSGFGPLRRIRQFLLNTFLPNSDVIPEYYRFIRLRAIQRLISSTNNVLGTQALLYSLGIKSKHLGIAAATSWVLKDTLGKLARVFWAGKFGRKFDSDAKKWRFRSALFFAAGNALEIVTYLFPTLFLISAATGNALKQIAMLTASATRNTIYKSFSRTADNIGELTAKGEAQIAVVDLIGMCIGVGLAKAINARVAPIVLAFVTLSAFDLILVYKEIQSVVFYTFNFERLRIVLDGIFAMLDKRSITDLDNTRRRLNSIIDDVVGNDSFDPLVKGTLEQISLFPTPAGKTWIPTIFSKNKATTKDADIDEQSSTLLDQSKSQRADKRDEDLIEGTVVADLDLLKMSDLHPRRVANIENLLQPANPGNGLLRGWSTLSSEGLNSFHRYLQSDSIDTNDMFVVLSHVRCLKNWFEAWQIKVGLRTNEILRTRNGRIPVIINTEILLKPDATATDFFRATIIVNRILYQFKQLTEDVDIDRAAGLLQSLPVSSSDRSDAVDKSGFDTVFVDELRSSAMKFEKTNARDIRHILSQAEWDLRSFSFGSLDVRVNWQK